MNISNKNLWQAFVAILKYPFIKYNKYLLPVLSILGIVGIFLMVVTGGSKEFAFFTILGIAFLLLKFT